MRARVLRAIGVVWGITILLTAGMAHGDDAPQGIAGDGSGKIDISAPGTYRSGQWEYRLVVTAPGSKSQGSRGELLFGGKPVDEPARGNYFRTPWGEIHWVGNPGVPWGPHGWMPRPKQCHDGRDLGEPWLENGAPVVMAVVLGTGKEGAEDTKIDPWVREEMQRLGVEAPCVTRAWFPLTDQATTLHDTKLYGTLTVRVCPAREAEKLTVLLDGTKTERLDLPRQDGATRLIRQRLDSGIARQDFYLAFRVDRAAPDWPRPLDIGLEAEGKEVLVKGTKEVVISLPGDKRSGLVWSVKGLQGDALLASSVKSSGGPQFAPANGAAADTGGRGLFENVFRVTGCGKTHVELEYNRPWQSDKPAKKTYRVTLDVQP